MHSKAKIVFLPSSGTHNSSARLVKWAGREGSSLRKWSLFWLRRVIAWLKICSLFGLEHYSALLWTKRDISQGQYWILHELHSCWHHVYSDVTWSSYFYLTVRNSMHSTGYNICDISTQALFIFMKQDLCLQHLPGNVQGESLHCISNILWRHHIQSGHFVVALMILHNYTISVNKRKAKPALKKLTELLHRENCRGQMCSSQDSDCC